MEILIIIAIIAAVIIQKNKATTEQRRKAAEAREAFEQRAAQSQARRGNESPEGRSEYASPLPWGSLPYEVPQESGEGGSNNGDPFCQGPAGKATSDEGLGGFEGDGGREGRYGFGGEGFTAPGLSGRTPPHAQKSGMKRSARVHDAAQPVETEQAPLAASLSFDLNAVVQGVLYAEILGKPKALRRG